MDGDVKVKDHFHVTGKHRRFARRNCNIKVKLNHNIPALFHNLKSYDSHFNMQELSRFNFIIYFISNGLEK